LSDINDDLDEIKKIGELFKNKLLFPKAGVV
jgi:hypothetical protein